MRHARPANRPPTSRGLVLSLLALSALPATAAEHGYNFPPPNIPPRNDIVVENLVPVPMRDGVTLYADVFRPTGDASHPVLVIRTPYSTERYPSAYDDAVYFARRGYAVVFQDVRGRHESEGRWEPFRDDEKDGYDTVEWAARQPWSNGKVGMDGGSYLGHVQWRAAMARPPSLVTIFPNVASTSLYHDWVTLNGAWRLSFNFGWGAVRQASRIMQNTGPHTMEGGPEGISYDKVLWHLPLNGMQAPVGRQTRFYQDWIAHPDYDEYWKALNVEEVFERIAVPVHTMGGFFDIFSQGTLRGYAGVSKQGQNETARRGSQMVIGPWGHGASREFGELDFGEHAYVDRQPLALRWFDHWLKNTENGLRHEPPVKIFLMGKNEWRFEDEYPLARTVYTPLYFLSQGDANSNRGGGRLSWQKPPSDSPPDHYRYDPDHPVPSHGGNNCCGTPTLTGPRDQRVIEYRNDILVYTSDFLDQEIEVTGPVKVVLYASSDAPDTDFVAKLIDVHPDGAAYNMAEGVLRARYHRGLGRPELLEPGKVYQFEIDLVGTSVAFLKGHRIRVDVTSSHFPQFDRNPNTGEPFGQTASLRVANQAIHHSNEYPSHVVLPVIPPK